MWSPPPTPLPSAARAEEGATGVGVAGKKAPKPPPPPPGGGVAGAEPGGGTAAAAVRRAEEEQRSVRERVKELSGGSWHGASCEEL